MRSGSQTLTQALRIVADPNSQATAADLQKQFDLLIAIRDKVSAAHDAVNEIREMLHDVGTGDNIDQGSGPDSAHRMRTAAVGLADAQPAHARWPVDVINNFRNLSATQQQQQQLTKFLTSL